MSGVPKSRGEVKLGDVLVGGKRVVSLGRIGRLVAWTTRDAAGEYDGDRGDQDEMVDLAVGWGAVEREMQLSRERGEEA